MAKIEKKILFIGQTPPPFHGQAIVIEKLWNYRYEKVKLYRIRLSFSDNLNEVGKFKIIKIYSLFRVLFHSLVILCTRKIDAVYFPPSGHKLVPVIRDVVLLNFLRLFRKKMIFHWHILGIKDFYSKSNSFIKYLLQQTYSNATNSVCLSKNNVEEISWLSPKKITVIHNGIEDNYSSLNISNEIPIILYVGNLYREKGIRNLLNAVEILYSQGMVFEINILGGFKEPEFEHELKKHNIYNHSKVNFKGIVVGHEKWNEFAKADIFCFPPTGAEAFPTVILEALSFGLPIVTTNAINSCTDMVKDNGFILEKGNDTELARILKYLIENEETRESLGRKSRELFNTEFRQEVYINKFESVFNDI